jgi:DNA-binding NarL/FixJ family response regulator
MFRHERIADMVAGISVSGVLLDRSGTIIEMSDDWKRQSEKWTTRPNVAIGDNYFEYCIRPDQHSIEILRGFRDLLARKVDFFSTIYWQQKAAGTRWFLIAASPHAPKPDATVVIHIDISPILRGDSQLSALLVGLGAAATAQLEANITSTIRTAIAETLAKTRDRAPERSEPAPAIDRRQLDRLSRPQIELLSYLADGLSNLEIAKARGISVNTVKDQVATVIAKLEVSNRTQAALFAVKNNIHSQMEEPQRVS